MKNPFSSAAGRHAVTDPRKRASWFIAGGGFVVLGGLLALLFIQMHGWWYVLETFALEGFIVWKFGAVCSKTIRRERFDSIDVTQFSMGTFVMLVSVIALFAVIYQQFGLLPSTAESRDPWTCLYFSVITWTTVGYGDFAPSPASRPFSALEAMTGYICMALLTAAILQVISKYRTPVTVSGKDLINGPR